MPVNDLIEHEFNDCVCGPLDRLVAGSGDGWLVIHNSLDGRERFE
jgi:hypothetical protein